MEDKNSKNITQIRTELELALYHHQQQFLNVLRALVCNLPFEEGTCDFHSSIPRIHQTHEAFHEQIKHIASKSQPLSPEEFDHLHQTLENHKNAIYAYQKELDVSLNNSREHFDSAIKITMLPILREQQSYAKQHSQSCSIAIIDIDLMEEIQNQYGQMTREKIHALLAQILVDHVRKYDRVFYFNHESFIISLQQVNAAQALELMDRLRSKINKTAMNIGSVQPFYITVSCGITELTPAFTVEQSLEQANIALYLAKKSGGNNAKLWSHDLRQS